MDGAVLLGRRGTRGQLVSPAAQDRKLADAIQLWEFQPKSLLWIGADALLDQAAFLKRQMLAECRDLCVIHKQRADRSDNFVMSVRGESNILQYSLKMGQAVGKRLPQTVWKK